MALNMVPTFSSKPASILAKGGFLVSKDFYSHQFAGGLFAFKANNAKTTASRAVVFK